MLGARSIHGIKIVAIIATFPRFQPVNTSYLSRQLGFSVSYTESIVKELKDGGLLSSHRGPGGGYLLQIPQEDLSIWDISSCFVKPNSEITSSRFRSSEALRLSSIDKQMYEKAQFFLQNYALTNITKNLPKSQTSTTTKSMGGLFKPVKRPELPKAPNSVFDLSNFLKYQVA